MIAVGNRLNLDFEVKVGIGGVKTSRAFKDLVEGPTLVSVYMRNNTGSCDKQMISLAASTDAIRGKGFAILGVSRDTVGSHMKYTAKHEIGFPLISDPEYGFAQATDSLVEKKLYGRAFVGPSRSAYAIDQDGTVLAICEKVDPANHGEQLLALIEGL
ncbi:MAG: peroxiredoxin Q/BCP [Candidatus Pelagisphaera sp.]|jgi:peroxiredoxin Q/BCP